jgi:uncharacterized protein
MPRVVHFEVHAEDPERALAFYSAVLGWEFSQWEGVTDYWLIRTGEEGQPGIDGGMVRRRGTIDGEAVIAFVCTVDVPSVDEYVERALAAGGTMALPKMPIPGVGWLAYVKDTEGNVFGMMQSDSTAA